MIKDSSRRQYRARTIRPTYKPSNGDKAILISGAIVLALFVGFISGLVIGVDIGYNKCIQTVIKE